MEYRHTSVRLPVTVAAELESLARKRGTQVSVMLREVVERGLKHTGVLDEAVLAKETRKLLAVTMRKVAQAQLEPSLQSFLSEMTRVRFLLEDIETTHSTTAQQLESAVSSLANREASSLQALQEAAKTEVKGVGKAAIAQVQAVGEGRTWRQRLLELIVPALFGAVVTLVWLTWFPAGPPRISESQERDLAIAWQLKDRFYAADEQTQQLIADVMGWERASSVNQEEDTNQ